MVHIMHLPNGIGLSNTTNVSMPVLFLSYQTSVTLKSIQIIHKDLTGSDSVDKTFLSTYQKSPAMYLLLVHLFRYMHVYVILIIYCHISSNVLTHALGISMVPLYSCYTPPYTICIQPLSINHMTPHYPRVV